MYNKKKINKKIIAGVSLCAIALSGVVSYGIYNTIKPAETEETGSPLNPTESKKQTPLFPDRNKSSKKEDSVTKSVKKETQESSLEDFKTVPFTDYSKEKTQALSLLNNRVQQEQQAQRKQQEVTKEKEQTPQNNKPVETKPNGPSDTGNKPVQPKPKPEPEKPIEPEIPPVIEVDYSALETLVQQAQGINLSLYLSSGFEQFRLELLVSQRLLEDLSSSQQVVNNQVYRLQQAINQLVLKGDKTELQGVYQNSQSIKTDIYTEATVLLFEEAKQQAKAVLDNVEVSQIQVDQAKQSLNEATEGLKEKEEPYLSLAYLQRLVDQAQKINVSEYTTGTVLVFTTKLNEVTDYLTTNNYTKETNEKYTDELQQVMDQLQKKADNSKIEALLATIATIDREKYTEDTLINLDTVVSSVQEKIGNEELTQAESDNLYHLLFEAFSQLEEKNVTEQEK